MTMVVVQKSQKLVKKSHKRWQTSEKKCQKKRWQVRVKKSETSENISQKVTN